MHNPNNAVSSPLICTEIFEKKLKKHLSKYFCYNL